MHFIRRYRTYSSASYEFPAIEVEDDEVEVNRLIYIESCFSNSSIISNVTEIGIRHEHSLSLSISQTHSPSLFSSRPSLPPHIKVMRIRDTLSAEFSRLCYYGFWYAPEMELVMNSIDFSQRHVTGAVELKLYKGNTIVMGRESPVALYRSVVI